jgi:hypothetical protein
VDTKDALSQIINDLKNNMFGLSFHALQRMGLRNLQVQDILALIEGGALGNPEWNDKHESWNFTGTGFAGEPFTIACAYENDGTLIVTVFWE